MGFIEKLPTYYAEIQSQKKNTENKISDLQREIGDDDYGLHDCDCEYCPVPERPDLSPSQCRERESEIEELTDLVHDYKVAIKRLEGYAKLVNTNLQGGK